jgi:hypothetical protein
MEKTFQGCKRVKSLSDEMRIIWTQQFVVTKYQPRKRKKFKEPDEWKA